MNLRHIIAQGEGETVDFKKSITNNTKIARHIVAFANQKGGMLLVGVADDGTVKGVKSEEEEKYMILKSCHQLIKPVIEPTFEEIYLDQKLVLVVHIPEGDCKPHLALDNDQKWWAYLRIEDKSVLASKIMMEVLKQQKAEKGILIQYSENEAFLLKHIEKEGKITLKTLCKLRKLSHKAGQKMIVKLLLTGVLKPVISEKEEYFVLAQEAF